MSEKSVLIVYLDSLVSSIGFLFSNISAEDNQYNNIQHLALVTTDYIALVTTDHIALVTITLGSIKDDRSRPFVYY